MTKQWIGGLIVAAALVFPTMSWAHGGHDHTVMGTISSVQGNNVMVKTTAGKAMMVMLDAKTEVMEGKTKVQASSLKVGQRVVASGPEEKGMISAETIRIGTAAPTASAKGAKAPAHAHTNAH